MIDVSISGNPGAYTFAVTISSPDTGCGQYADWWEVVFPDGRLIYRRVLLHSHTGEQPFTRWGGRVDVQPDEIFIVRGHMNRAGYGGAVLKGSVAGGLTTTNLSGDFGGDLALQSPLPPDCEF